MTPLWLTSICSFALMTCGCSASESRSEKAVRSSQATEAGSFEEQVAAYLVQFPYQLTYDYMVRFTGGDPAKLNTWVPGGEPALVKAGGDILPRTNNDTYYKGATLFLDNGPIVLGSNAPSADRFASFQLIDDRNVNYRNIVHPKGMYTLYFGDKPEEIEGEAIEVPSKLSVVLARVEVRDKNDPEDVASATAVFHGLTIDGAQPREFPRLDLLSGYAAEVVAEANRRMDETAATVPFTQTVVGPGREPGRDVPYLHHSAGTKLGWGGPDPSHSAFENVFLDANGREMKGSFGTYSVTTDDPPVGAFWSVTVYDHDRGGFLHPNAAGRYHINNTSAVRNTDGTATFVFKEACEASGANCLEVPAGRFDLTVRYYLPREEILAHAWTFPKVELLARRDAAE
jgi:hypothetical protein